MQKDIIKILNNFKQGAYTLEETVHKLSYEDLGELKLDHQRAYRNGFPEVVYAPGKSNSQLITAISKLSSLSDKVLVTRASEQQAQAVLKEIKQVTWHDRARCMTLGLVPALDNACQVAIVTAGTADIPIAAEAELTLQMHDIKTELVCDVGVAGIHRLLPAIDKLRTMQAVIVVAGMEGALASVIGGLVSVPVIAVPTSVGYGAHFSGLAPLLSMLNSCASGVTVVNIDNGFGAATAAAAICRSCKKWKGAKQDEQQ